QLDIKQVILARDVDQFTARSNGNNVCPLKQRLVQGSNGFLRVATVRAGNKQRMRTNKLRYVVTFAHRYRNGYPAKRERLHQISAYARTAHSGNYYIADVASRTYQIYGITDFQRLGQLAGKAFNVFLCCRHSSKFT